MQKVSNVMKKLLKIVTGIVIIGMIIIVSLNLFGILGDRKVNNDKEIMITEGFLADASCNAVYHDINEYSKKYSLNIDDGYLMQETSRGNLMNELKALFCATALKENPGLKMSSFLRKIVWEIADFTKFDVESLIGTPLNTPKLPDGDYTIRKIILKNIETNEVLAYLVRYVCFIDESKRTKSFDIIYTRDDFQLDSSDTDVFYENGQLSMPTYEITDYYEKVGLIGCNLSYQGNGYCIFSQIDVTVSYIKETIPNRKIPEEHVELLKSLIRGE